jgi:hypothetical protein
MPQSWPIEGPSIFDEHRRFMRVNLLQPVVGVAGEESIYILDASLQGVRVSHRSLFTPRADCNIGFEWDGAPIELVGTVRWTKLQRLGSAAYAKTIYQSGLEIATIGPEAQMALRSLIEVHVERALDEQKANAKGIPPIAAQSVQMGESALYARHEFVRGTWRKLMTSDPAQPVSGFTLSTEESRDQVELLRSAYVTADANMRTVIRKLAELSIANPDGIPTRRYTP